MSNPTSAQQKQPTRSAKAEQSCNSKPQHDGRSFKMRGFERVRKTLTTAALMLLLLLTAGLSANLSAQVVAAPEPWPTPAAVPPPPAKIPAAQTVTTGFDMTGMLQYASLDSTPGLCDADLTNPNPGPANPPLPDQCKTTGGWLEVGNVTVKVPANLVVVFPNTLMTWEEAFEFNPLRQAGLSVIETGLAMADTQRLPGNYIVHVQGNIVNGQYIAGLVFINQVIADAEIQGFIEKFDYANSIMYVNGTRVQINDPKLNIPVIDPTTQTPAVDANGNQIFLPPKGRYSA